MILWRIEYSRHLDGSLGGTGAQLHGGRWNQRGTAIVYLSSNLSLAAFEKFVHAQPSGQHDALFAVGIEVPDGLIAHAARPSPLPRAWRSPEPDAATLQWGTDWAASNASVAAVVPSVLLPLDQFEQGNEFNAMLNPDHPDMSQIRVAARLPYSFDPRMWKR
jgi:RES domain-containing protein